MRRGLAAGLAALALSACGSPSHEQRPCLPPVYDGGQRLHGLPGPRVFNLELLLRQHELCWRQPARADEARILLLGSSAVFGFPLPVEQSVGAYLNARLAADDVPAHVFNAAFVFTYQLRDAVILDAALAYRPDVIVYPLTLADFPHVAPARYPPQLISFFIANLDRLERLTETPPPGLEEPFERYKTFVANQRVLAAAPLHAPLRWARDATALLRAGLRDRARRTALALTGTAPPPEASSRGRQPTYDCAKTHADTARRYGADWASWNILASLEALQRERGIPVLIVYWPLAHEPQGDCYSIRYTNAQVDEFGAWMRRETAARGLAYRDLHQLLPDDLFLDSLHPSAAGQARIADALAPAIAALVRDRGRAASPDAVLPVHRASKTAADMVEHDG